MLNSALKLLCVLKCFKITGEPTNQERKEEEEEENHQKSGDEPNWQNCVVEKKNEQVMI